MKIIAIMICCLFSFPVGSLRAQDGPQDNYEQWQLTVDVIKGKVEQLSQQSDQLNAQYQSLQSQEEKIYALISEKNRSNAAIHRFLKLRNGKTEQQMRIEELIAALKERQAPLGDLSQKASVVSRQVQDAQKVVDLKRAKIAEWELHQNMPPAVLPPEQAPIEFASEDPELDRLRQELESQKKQEVLLEYELSSIASKRTEDPELGALRQRVELMSKLKADLLAKKSVSSTASSQGPQRQKYLMMVERKDRLEAKIRLFESKMDQTRNPTESTMTWGILKKQVVSDIVTADMQNALLRERINNMRQNTLLLQDRVSTLEKNNKR